MIRDTGLSLTFILALSGKVSYILILVPLHGGFMGLSLALISSENIETDYLYK